MQKITICVLFLVAVASCIEVYGRAEEMYNITTLYPVTNDTIHKPNYDEQRKQRTEPDRSNYKTNAAVQQDDKDNSDEGQKTEMTVPRNLNIAKWKIDATYVQPKDTEIADSNSTESKETVTVVKTTSKTVDKEFKPSPHLGSFFDEENLNVLKFSGPKPYPSTEKKPTLDFTSSKGLYMLNYRSPEHTYRDPSDEPYKFDSSYFPQTDSWKVPLDSRPTVESPTKVPAGGLYKHANPFKEKPSSNGDDDDFGLSFTEDGKEKEILLKKRSNPWKHLLSLATALIPVGLIVSALTPSVITIHSTNDDPHLNRLSRRLDEGFASVPQISERCKRRLLCEIHSEDNYIRSRDKAAYARKHCYKIYCEDPQALSRVLHWLLARRPPRSPPQLPARPEPPHHGQYKEDQLNTNLMHHHRSYEFT